MYKHFRIFGVLIFFAQASFAQQRDTSISEKEIIGVWQIKSEAISAALQSNFSFSADGKFVYQLNQYNELNPVKKIFGTYKLKSGILYFKIEKFSQISGFKIVETSPGFQTGVFTLDGGQEAIIKQNDLNFTEHELKAFFDLKHPSKKYITIDGDKYFRIANDPTKFNR